MKQADVVVGGQFVARVSGRLCVLHILEERPASLMSGKKRWLARNLRTDKRIVVTAARLRPLAGAAPLLQIQARADAKAQPVRAMEDGGHSSLCSKAPRQ